MIGQVGPDSATAKQRGRIEALQNLIEQCYTCEPHCKNPIIRASQGATAQMEDTTFALEDVQPEHEIQDL